MEYLNNLIRAGCEIFPVEDKKPLTKHGDKDATNDILTIKEWCSKFPNCHWALRLDKANLIVADFDNHKNEAGKKAFLNLSDEQQKTLAKYPIDLTNHGWHLFMKLPKGQKLDQSRYEVKKGLEILTLQINLYKPNKSILEAPEAPQFILDMLKLKNEPRFNINNQNKTRWAGKIINKISTGDGLRDGDGRNVF